MERGSDVVQDEGWCTYVRDTQQCPDQACFSSLSSSNPPSTNYTHIPKKNRVDHELQDYPKQVRPGLQEGIHPGMYISWHTLKLCVKTPWQTIVRMIVEVVSIYLFKQS
jgi:hypothetical protein